MKKAGHLHGSSIGHQVANTNLAPLALPHMQGEQQICIAALIPILAPLALPHCLCLLSSSARVTSVESAKGLGQRHADPYIGPGIPESDKKETKETNFRDLSLTFTTLCWNG